MVSLALHDVHLSFEPTAPVLAGLDLAVADGELLALLGPSGCGKTTTLRLIAGLVSPDRGDIRFDDISVLGVPPEKRRVAMVFQEPALFPFRTVHENVAFGLELQNVPKSERPARVEDALSSVQLESFGERWPSELSGGQRQRVALARALVVRPRLLLLDEPLSSLDQDLRASLRQTICEVQRATAVTTVLVTHDEDEAATMADQVVRMVDGSVAEEPGAVADGRGRDAIDAVPS